MGILWQPFVDIIYPSLDFLHVHMKMHKNTNLDIMNNNMPTDSTGLLFPACHWHLFSYLDRSFSGPFVSKRISVGHNVPIERVLPGKGQQIVCFKFGPLVVYDCI